MEIQEYHGAFNARWLTPEEVARGFVPILQFQKLVHSTHSILLGPRGSGKTTLLKMLTSNAINTWKSERGKDITTLSFNYPQFEAIYIPSDIRWAYEIGNLEEESFLDSNTAILVQRALVSTSILTSLIETFESMCKLNNVEETVVCKELIRLWEIKDTIPLFLDLNSSVRKFSQNIRASLNFRDEKHIKNTLDLMPKILFGHIADAPVNSCLLISDLFKDRMQHDRWALCFDELEIAPKWLKKEILESLRSIDQKFFLKLTWSPIMPSGLSSEPGPADDFNPIRLWHSHIDDARDFCEDLAKRVLGDLFKNEDITPNDFLSYSVLGETDKEENVSIYNRGSTVYETMIDLAKIDTSFKEYLIKKKIDPEDPYSESPHLRDTVFRKLKPIILLRFAFLKKDSKKRSRKVVSVYAGKQAVYAMSEGNPRWLLGLLTDLFDRWVSIQNFENRKPKIPYAIQAKALNNAARRFESFLTAIAAYKPNTFMANQESMYDFLQNIGITIRDQFLGEKFPTDPFGSFTVNEDADETTINAIKKALEVGALVYIGTSDAGVPDEIINSRFRLTFMLSPVFRLPFRNYRSVSLELLKQKRLDDKQLTLC